jgi:hypothetical protein
LIPSNPQNGGAKLPAPVGMTFCLFTRLVFAKSMTTSRSALAACSIRFIHILFSILLTPPEPDPACSQSMSPSFALKSGRNALIWYILRQNFVFCHIPVCKTNIRIPNHQSISPCCPDQIQGTGAYPFSRHAG